MSFTPQSILKWPYKAARRVIRYTLGTITHVSTQEPIAALTFDDGPHPEFTPRLLEILNKHRARATFFMVGKVAQEYPNLVKQVAQAGHAIGNHSWEHPPMPFLSGQARRKQIRACSQSLAPYGHRLFRPPYGNQTLASRLDALWLGYQVVAWNLMAEDWLDDEAERLADRMINQLKPGSIILLHDALYDTLEERYADREPTLKAVSLLLDQVGNRFQFVTIPELLQRGRPQRRIWRQTHSREWFDQLKS